MSDRAEFHKWCISQKDEHGLPFFVSKREDGTYIDHCTVVAWQAWQAARAQSGQEVEQVNPSEPLPCHFCGSRDVGGAGGTVHCYRCNAKIEVQNTNTPYAVELWNRRTFTHPQPAQQGGLPEADDGKGSLHWFVEVYNKGYQAGHNDTVEGWFTDVHYSDLQTYHEDEVMELLEGLNVRAHQEGAPSKAQTVPEGYAAIPKDIAAAKGMYLVGYSWLKHNAPQELATPQPEGDGCIPDWLYDGYAVYQNLTEEQKTQTSAKNVSDTLDAIVAMLKRPQPPKEGA